MSLRPAADFGQKVRIEAGGLSAAEIEAKVKEAVAAGGELPKSYYQSGAPLLQPAVIE
jgi:hypothetical protein